MDEKDEKLELEKAEESAEESAGEPADDEVETLVPEPEPSLEDVRRLCLYLQNEIDYLNRKVNSLQQVYTDVFTELFITDRAFRNSLLETGQLLGMDIDRFVEENQYRYSKAGVREKVLAGLRGTINQKFKDYFKSQQ